MVGDAAGSMIGCIHVLFQPILVAIFKFNYHGTIRVDPDIHINTKCVRRIIYTFIL